MTLGDFFAAQERRIRQDDSGAQRMARVRTGHGSATPEIPPAPYPVHAETWERSDVDPLTASSRRLWRFLTGGAD